MGRKKEIVKNFAEHLQANMSTDPVVVINKETSHVDLEFIEQCEWNFCCSDILQAQTNHLQMKVEKGCQSFLSFSRGFVGSVPLSKKYLLKIEKFIDIMNSNNIKTVIK